MPASAIRSNKLTPGRAGAVGASKAGAAGKASGKAVATSSKVVVTTGKTAAHAVAGRSAQAGRKPRQTEAEALAEAAAMQEYVRSLEGDELWDHLLNEGVITEKEWRAARGSGAKDFKRYQFDPERYIIEKLGWQPWSGANGQPGQVEILQAYTLSLRQQHEKVEYEEGRLRESELRYWKPGEIIKNRFRVEAGHTVGKTKLASGITNHFFDCFPPAIGYTYAPTWFQVKSLLWKEIKVDRADKGLTGRVLDTCEIKTGRADHFAVGRATNDNQGRGTERTHGQHGKYLIFIIDEAEGVADFVFDAIDSMTSGGISIILMLANPRTRSSKFHKQKDLSNVKSFRLSCIHHPNVVAGREVVPNAVKRDYVLAMVEKHCDVVSVHNEDDYTFELPFDVPIQGETFPAGTIYKPNSEFLFRVLGIAPANIADKTLISVGRYEAATKRVAVSNNPHIARIGVDVSRFGADYGTEYINHGGRVWRARQFWKQDTIDYYQDIKADALDLAKAGVTNLHIRIDGGGGFGGGVIDNLKRDLELQELFEEFRVLEVHFNGTPHDEKAYADLATEMYGHAAESIKGLRICNPPETLEGDLCERFYGWVNKQSVSVKKLESKDEFRKPNRMRRSPDDGDGFVLSTAPDFIFSATPYAAAPHVTRMPGVIPSVVAGTNEVLQNGGDIVIRAPQGFGNRRRF